MIGAKATSVNSPIDGLVEELRDKDVLDTAIIAAAQAVEHNEITRVLEQTLSEERAADKKLTAVAGSKVT